MVRAKADLARSSHGSRPGLPAGLYGLAVGHSGLRKVETAGAQWQGEKQKELGVLQDCVQAAVVTRGPGATGGTRG